MTPEARKAIADIFRRLSRKEKLSESDLEPAVMYLIVLPGFKKVKADVWNLFSHCALWFYKKEQVFAEASDEEVIRQVRNRFRAYPSEQKMAKEPTTVPCPECKGTGQDSERRYVCQVCFGSGCIEKPSPSYPEQFPEIVDSEGNRIPNYDIAATGEQRKGYKLPSTSWQEMVVESDYERARQKAEARRWLKSWQRFLRKIRWMPAVQRSFLSRLKRKSDHLDDPDAQAEDLWRAADEINKAIERARKRNRPR